MFGVYTLYDYNHWYLIPLIIVLVYIMVSAIKINKNKTEIKDKYKD